MLKKVNQKNKHTIPIIKNWTNLKIGDFLIFWSEIPKNFSKNRNIKLHYVTHLMEGYYIVLFLVLKG